MIRMRVSILFGLRDDLHFDEGAEVNGGLRGGEGDGDFGLAGCNRFSVPNREYRLKKLSVVSDEERRCNFIGLH